MFLSVISRFSTRLAPEMLKQTNKPHTSLPISTARKSPPPQVILMLWPSNPRELEPQLWAGGWGLCHRVTQLYCGTGLGAVRQDDSALLWHSDRSLAAFACSALTQKGKLKLRMVPF